MIKGITNSGKTEFFTQLSGIFPCLNYVQQHGSNFSVDYKQQKDYDHNKYHPSFFIADEGAYHSLFENSNLADAKEFFGGKGKAL